MLSKLTVHEIPVETVVTLPIKMPGAELKKYFIFKTNEITGILCTADKILAYTRNSPLILLSTAMKA